jgi:hypothetical protein
LVIKKSTVNSNGCAEAFIRKVNEWLQVLQYDIFVTFALDNTTKMSYSLSEPPSMGRTPPMTRHERLVTVSDVVCCACERALSVQELEEFYGASDDELHDDPYCRSCLERHLRLCPECSGRYTAGGVCGECRGREEGNIEQGKESEEGEAEFGKATSPLVTSCSPMLIPVFWSEQTGLLE